MASELHNAYRYSGGQNHAATRVAIAVAQWHPDLTATLFEGAVETLSAHGVAQITRVDVPGSYELPQAAQVLAASENFDAIIALGVVIKGETRHDDYINHAVAQGLQDVALHYELPVVFGVLTTENLAQAQARAGGSHGHKGKEAAVAALQMLDLHRAYTAHD